MGKGKRTKRERKAKELSARKRAEVIFNVRGGHCTASDGAAELGVSRKTFYQWENKALAAMAGALEEKEPGRPEQSGKDKEIAALRERLSAIERERDEERRTAELKIEHLKLELAVERRQPGTKSLPYFASASLSSGIPEASAAGPRHGKGVFRPRPF